MTSILTANSLDEESWKITSDLIDKTYPQADLLSNSLIGWFSCEPTEVDIPLNKDIKSYQLITFCSYVWTLFSAFSFIDKIFVIKKKRKKKLKK